jgi:hypothetical protein
VSFSYEGVKKGEPKKNKLDVPSYEVMVQDLFCY